MTTQDKDYENDYDYEKRTNVSPTQKRLYKDPANVLFFWIDHELKENDE